MNDGAIKEIKKALEPLADKIGQGAEFTYQVFYKQVMVDSIIKIVVGSILTIGVLYALRKLIKYGKKNNDGEAIILGGVVLAIPMVIAPLVAISGVKGLVNPHYYTIEKVINSVKAKEIR